MNDADGSHSPKATMICVQRTDPEDPFLRTFLSVTGVGSGRRRRA